MKLELFPSVDPSALSYIDAKTSLGQTLTWWRPTDFFDYPKLSASALLWAKTSFLRNKLRAPKETHISYELVGEGYEPFDMLVEKAVQNVEDRDFIIVPATENSPELSEKQFFKVPQDRGSVLAPIGGSELNEMEKWVGQAQFLDGYHIAATNDLPTILGAFILQHEFFPKKRLHLRGVSGEKAFQLVGALASTSEGPVSVETSAHLAGVTAGIYFRPNSVKGMARLLKGTELDSIPCDCPVCSSLLEIGALSEKVPARTVPIVLHNLYQIIRYVRIYENIYPIYEQAKTEGLQRTGYSSMSGFHPEVLRLIEGFSFYREHGWELAKERPLALLGAIDPNQKLLFQTPETAPPEPCLVCGEAEGRYPFHSVIGEGLICDSCKRFFEEAEKVTSP
jgi:hypothetical protein